MKRRFLLKLEAGGVWHCFSMEAEHLTDCVVRLGELGTPLEAHFGHRLARSDEDHPEPTRADIIRLETIGWTKHGELVNFRPDVTLSLTRELRARGVDSLLSVKKPDDYVVSWEGEDGRMQVTVTNERSMIELARSTIKSLQGIPEGESSAGAARAFMLLYSLAIVAKQAN